MTDKEKKIVLLLNQTLEESVKLDTKNRVEKARKGEFDEGGDNIVTHNLKMLKELIFS